jgi:hypothetical protein
MRICGKAANTVNTVEAAAGIPWLFWGTREKRRKEGKNLYKIYMLTLIKF